MMENIVVFVPERLFKQQPGYLFGKTVYDATSCTKKFYVIDVYRKETTDASRLSIDLIGYYWGSETSRKHPNRKYADWINVHLYPSLSAGNVNYEYCLRNVIVNDRRIAVTLCNTIVIMYDQLALREMELLVDKFTIGSHFVELINLLQNMEVRYAVKKKPWLVATKEVLLVSQMSLYLYFIFVLTKFTKFLLPLLKYSALGLHVNNWLENMKWMLITLIQNKRFTLKTANYACAVALDMAAGMFVLGLLSGHMADTSWSEMLLSNAQVVVESLKDLINWLMGAPAGLKLNYAFNKTLGKFFLYHIHLWWTFLVFTRPMMDFAFAVLLLFGRVGITFQLSIAADLLALISFHSYCIYVYAARLFNIQLRGLAALFRLFLGKKMNPLRERIDTCRYQPDQLFVGTLLFTILLFLMPTTLVYYIVFSIVRLTLIGFNGFLTRLKFYLHVMPVYAFVQWLLQSFNVRTSVVIGLRPQLVQEHVTLSASTATSSWSETWEKCIPDTIKRHSAIEWSRIINNLIRGELLYPL